MIFKIVTRYKIVSGKLGKRKKITSEDCQIGALKCNKRLGDIMVKNVRECMVFFNHYFFILCFLF